MKGNYYNTKGQITVYLAITFTLIVSMFLSCFEAVRANAMQLTMECAMSASLSSAFGEYNRELFERFGLLYVDMSYLSNEPDSKRLEQHLKDYFAKTLNLSEDEHLLFVSDWMDVTATSATVNGYRLATDDSGASFKSQAVNYIKDSVPVNLYDNIGSWLSVYEEYDLSGDSFEEQYEETQEELNECIKIAKDENNWDVTSFGDNGIQLVLLEPFDLAILDWSNLQEQLTKGVDTKYVVSKRDIAEGYGDFELDKANLTDEIIYDEYIMNMLGCYTKPIEGSAIDNEIEYVLFGFENDYLNFSITIKTIFFTRCASNIITLQRDDIKKKEIQVASKVLSMICRYVPEAVWEAVICVVWSYFESVSDIRRLMKGERIPLIKSGDDMKISLNGLLEGITEDDSGSEGIIDEDGNIELGLCYRDYLRLYLLIMLPSIKNERVMDMVEQDIRMTEDNEYFRLDACVDAVDVVFSLDTGFGQSYMAERKYYFY